jgi:hypothetical protein
MPIFSLTGWRLTLNLHERPFHFRTYQLFCPRPVLSNGSRIVIVSFRVLVRLPKVSWL